MMKDSRRGRLSIKTWLTTCLALCGLQQWNTWQRLSTLEVWFESSSASSTISPIPHRAIGSPAAFAIMDMVSKRGKSEFSWQMVDMDRKPDCGHFKCLFRSKSDPDHIAYLITTEREEHAQFRAYDISSGIDRLLLTNPQKDSPYRQDRLHFYARIPPWVHPTMPEINHELQKFRKRQLGGYIGEHQLTIQQVDMAPISEMAILSCADSRIEKSLETLQEVLPPTREALNQFQFSMNEYVLPVLEIYPNLVFDFQVLVNAKGELYHFDLDRGRRPPPIEEFQECHERLNMHIKVLKERLANMEKAVGAIADGV